jgi:hypothetical protein
LFVLPSQPYYGVVGRITGIHENEPTSRVNEQRTR